MIVVAGELGWELYVPFERTEEVYNTLFQAGQQHGIGHFGAYAMNTLRLEKGIRAWKTEVIKMLIWYGFVFSFYLQSILRLLLDHIPFRLEVLLSFNFRCRWIPILLKPD